MAPSIDAERGRRLLCALGAHVRDAVVAARDAALTAGEAAPDTWQAVARESASDALYPVDRVAEDALLSWLDARWPEDLPVELVVEGLDEQVVVPESAREPVATLIVDPVDGTRTLTHDKRAAWVLAALAPRGDDVPTLRDVVAAATAEIPTSKQRRADRISAVRGAGPAGVVGERIDLDTGATARFHPRPSGAVDLRHGYASFARFFPEGKELLARFEQRVWHHLYGHDPAAWLPVFDDQYPATGGQMHELLVGHDRLLGDLRPLAHAALGLDRAMAAHPYDCGAALLLEEAGAVLTDPEGAPLDPPLDTTTPVAWIGYANPELARRVRPAVERALDEVFPERAGR